MSTRLSYRVAAALALVVAALALMPLGASARSTLNRTSTTLRSPAWMRNVPFRRTAPVGGALTEAELPGAYNPSEPFAAASQAVKLYPITGQPTPVGEGSDSPHRITRGNSGGVGAVVSTVNPVSRDFSLSLGDLFVPERGVPLGLSLTYNSYFASTDGPFGPGWSVSVGMSLTRAADGSVTISQENGSQVTFKQTALGYTAEPRVIASLYQSSGTFVFTRGTRSAKCPRYSRSCVTFSFSAPGSSTPGRLTAISSPDGGLGLSYNAAGRLLAVNDPAGRQLTFRYAQNGQVTTSSVNGLAAETKYDANGNLTRFTNAGGGRYGFLYDAYHRVTGIIDPRGVETDIAYDTGGAVQSITGPTGETDFSGSAGHTSVTDPSGLVTTLYYPDGEVTRVDEGDPAAPLATTLVTYDPATLGATAVTNPDGHTSHMSYDNLGHLTSFTDPMGHTSTYAFDAAMGVITATDPMGTVSRAKTDTTGRLLQSTLNATDPALKQTTAFSYGSTAHPGDITSVTDPEGHVWSFAYDQFGDPTQFTDPLGDTTTTVYDRMGRPAINTALNNPATGAAPPPTTYSYDPEGRLVSATDPAGNTGSDSYDLAGNLIASVAGGNQTSYGYDAAGRWNVVTRPTGSHATISYKVNAHAGEVCDDGGNCDDYTYDDLGRPVSVKDALGNTTSYVYSPGGLLVSQTDANGVTTSYAHNADGQTTSVSYSDGITHSVVADFDADGRMISMTDATGTSTFTYDALGRKTREVSGLGMETEYTYDRLNHVTSIKLNSALVAAYTYDAAGRMVSLRDRAGNVTTFGYDASGNVTQTSFPGGAVDSNSYDAAGRQVSALFKDAAGNTASIVYRRNLLGQITGTTETGTGETDQSYAYDSNGFLSSVDGIPANSDSRGNLVHDGYGNSFTYDNADRLVSQAQKSNGTTTDWQFGYDHNGSRTSAFTLDGTRSHDFVWDAAGNLASFSDGSTTESNTYDGLGRRVLLNNGSNTVVSVWASTHAGNRVWGSGPSDAHETDKDCGGSLACAVARITKPGLDDYRPPTSRTAPPSGPLASDGTVYLYGPDGLAVEQLDSSGHALFFHHDQLGSTRAVTDATGHTVAVMAYDAWGNETYHSGVSVPFGFAGAYTDPVSRLVLFGGNYYDPTTAGFLSLPPSSCTAGQDGGETDKDCGGAGRYILRAGVPVRFDSASGTYFSALASNPLYAAANGGGDNPFFERTTPTCASGEVLLWDTGSTACKSSPSFPSFTPDVAGQYRVGARDSCRNAILVGGEAAASCGLSPYSFGGGDPVNKVRSTPRANIQNN